MGLHRAAGRRPLRPSSLGLMPIVVLLVVWTGVRPARGLPGGGGSEPPVLEVLVAEDGWLLHRFDPRKEGWAEPPAGVGSRRVAGRRSYVARAPGSDDPAVLLAAGRDLLGAGRARLQLRASGSVPMERVLAAAEALAPLRAGPAAAADPLAGVLVDARP